MGIHNTIWQMAKLISQVRCENLCLYELLGKSLLGCILRFAFY